MDRLVTERAIHTMRQIANSRDSLTTPIVIANMDSARLVY